jgi:hypothetical protein
MLAANLCAFCRQHWVSSSAKPWPLEFPIRRYACARSAILGKSTSTSVVLLK